MNLSTGAAGSDYRLYVARNARPKTTVAGERILREHGYGPMKEFSYRRDDSGSESIWQWAVELIRHPSEAIFEIDHFRVLQAALTL